MEARPLPEVGEEEVLVKVLAAGVCAGDAKCFAGAARYWGEAEIHCTYTCPLSVQFAWLKWCYAMLYNAGRGHSPY